MAFSPKKPCTGGSDVQTETESSHDIRGPGDVRGIALNPENEWVKLAKLIPWWAFEEKYAEQFSSETGQTADSFRMALGSQLIKERDSHFTNGCPFFALYAGAGRFLAQAGMRWAGGAAGMPQTFGGRITFTNRANEKGTFFGGGSPFCALFHLSADQLAESASVGRARVSWQACFSWLGLQTWIPACPGSWRRPWSGADTGRPGRCCSCRPCCRAWRRCRDRPDSRCRT